LIFLTGIHSGLANCNSSSQPFTQVLQFNITEKEAFSSSTQWPFSLANFADNELIGFFRWQAFQVMSG
jgi:hypothetical protein